jgi:hypothetical protein
MELDSVTAKRLRRAFPSSAAAAVDAVLRFVELGKHEPLGHEIVPVLVNGETLHIPHRIYSAEPNAETLVGLAEPARTVMECLYSRHHDGYVREKYLRDLISSPLAWVPPFVIQLLGEYVIEIHRVIWQNVGRLSGEPYRRFVVDNPAFIELTKQRVASYWNCYFRGRGQLRDHAAYQALQVLVAPRVAAQPAGAADGASPRR